MTIAKRIRTHIARIPAGTPFTARSLLALGSRASVDQTLSRLARSGKIARVTRGVYVKPLVNPYVGQVTPAPGAIAASIAKSAKAKVQVHGAEAARQLGLSTQMPGKPVYLTSGTSRHARIGKLELRLKSANPQQLVLAGRPAGTAMAALRYLGKGQVTPRVIEQVRLKLPASEFDALRRAVHAMPAWLSDAFHLHRKEFDHGPTVPRAA